MILGDGLELREAAHRDAVDVAGAFFAAVGEVLGPDKPLILLAGNHDHGIAAGWIDARLQTEPAGFLGLEQRFAPADAGPLAQRLAEAALPARVEFAYPGVWLRDDVYAFHGHYADVHATVPTFERLAAGAMARYVARLPPERATPDDYEAVLSPLFAWLHALTQRAEHTVVSAGSGASASTYAKLTASDRHKRPLQALALGLGYRAAVAGAQPRRARPAGGQPLTERAAPRLPARDQRDDPAAGHPRRLRHLGPLAPLRPVARGRRRGMDRADGRADRQHRLVGLPAALHRPDAERFPVLAGDGGDRRFVGPAAGAAARGPGA